MYSFALIGAVTDLLHVGVIGVGNMGSKYAVMIQNGEIPGMKLAALTRLHEQEQKLLSPSLEAGVPVFQNADALLDAVQNGSLNLDAVLVTTPHISHEAISCRALSLGLHVLCDKPSGVTPSQALHLNTAADEAAVRNGSVFAMMFNQRTSPVYQTLRDLVQSGHYGALKRVAWTVTDWYRPEPYYASSSWHARWDTDGGGVLLNQCPHNLDLLQWIAGMPVRLQAFCQFGHYHDIEVEDEATLYLEWENGATGTFITSTGEAPGTNRLEILLDEAKLVCDKGVLTITELEPELGMKEADYRRTSTEFFKKIHGVTSELQPGTELQPYQKVLRNFADACLHGSSLIADGREGLSSQLLINAAYLSSWEHRMVELPGSDSEALTRFCGEYQQAFQQHTGEATVH